MIKFLYKITTIFLFSTLLISCVTNRKYDDLESEFLNLRTQVDGAKRSMVEYEEKKANYDLQFKTLEAEKKELEGSLKGEKERYNRLKATYDELNSLYEKMITQNQSVNSNIASENQNLNAQIANKQMELDKRSLELSQASMKIQTIEADLKKREAQFEKAQVELNKMEEANKAEKELLKNKAQALEERLQNEEQDKEALSVDLLKREKRVQELESIIAQKDQSLTDLKNKINNALRGFQSSELTVQEKEGKVYVSLSQGLLFAPGSKTIDTKGKTAIAQLASALINNNEFLINVEGHTDSDGSEENNWDLSVARASTIVKELVKNGVEPKRVIASGRGEMLPVASNNTSEGKGLNRRTEIILTPNLNELYELLK